MNRPEKFVDNLFTRYRWLIHVFFWILVLAFYVVFFGRKNNNYQQTFFFVGLLMPVTIGTTYFLNYDLVPKFLMKERYGFFVLYFAYTLLGSIFLEMMIAMFTFMLLAEVKIRDMSPASVDIVFLLTSLLMVVFLGVAIKMLLYWRTSREEYQKLMRDKVETELRFLKLQLNPHFLFNTLNNLYYLTTEKSERAPQAILQLSEMLDYVMHSSKSIFVPLENELKQVANYVALELLRYEDRVHVETIITGDPQGYTIGPMILITLIENAFKHGVMKSTGQSWIKVEVNCDDSGVAIQIRNGYRSKTTGKGIGLENLRSQLDHLYSKNYNLKIEEGQPEEFSVNLFLNAAK